MTRFTKMGIGRIITGPWVDTSKGDAAAPGYCSRVVSKEFNVGIDTGLYADMLSPESPEAAIGHAPSRINDGLHMILMTTLDRAYFHAKVEREWYAELPAEDGDYVGRLAL